MLVSEIAYLKPNSVNVLTDSSVKSQSNRTNSSEGFGNYNKKSPYILNKVNFFEYIRESLNAFFPGNNNSDKVKNLSILA